MLTKGQKIALDHFLLGYDSKLSFEALLEGIIIHDPLITISEDYEDITRTWTADQIKTLSERIDQAFKSQEDISESRDITLRKHIESLVDNTLEAIIKDLNSLLPTEKQINFEGKWVRPA